MWASQSVEEEEEEREGIYLSNNEGGGWNLKWVLSPFYVKVLKNYQTLYDEQNLDSNTV